MQRLMRKMGNAALQSKVRAAKPAPRHKIFVCLMRHMLIVAGRSTFVPIGQGCDCLAGVPRIMYRLATTWGPVNYQR